MRKWMLGVTVLLLAGCTNNAALPGPVGVPKTPAAVYQFTPPENPEWQNLRPIKPAGEGTPVKVDFSLSEEQLYNAGVASLREQRSAEAIAYLSEAFRQRADNPQAAYQLGAAYELTGQVEKAKTVYQEALRQTPGDYDLKRALAALNGDFTMDGTPDRVEIKGSFFHFYDGTKSEWVQQYQPWQGETNLKVEVVDVGGPVPVVLVSSPKGTGMEVFRGDGFFAYAGQSAQYDPTRRQLIVRKPAQLSPTSLVLDLGYVRLKAGSDGGPQIDLQASPHGL